MVHLQRAPVDVTGFRAFYDAAFPAVYAYLVRRVGSRAVAEDLAQETFAVVAREVQAKGVDEVSVPWAIGVARHKLADHYRRLDRERRRWFRVRAEHVVSLDAHDDPLPAAAVLRALGALPPAQRAALVLHYLDDVSVAEVAGLLHKSASATDSLLARARDGFRRAYGGDVDD